MSIMNPKADAWDKIGGLFWSQGRVSARPSRTELDLFADGVGPEDRVCMVGASTRELAEELLARGASLTVLDFSSRMCDDLRDALGSGDIRTADITGPLPDDLLGRFSLVVSDRLVNRFDASEASAGIRGMASLLRPGGMVRTSVKLGLYAMDETMLEHAAAAGTAHTFWDETTRTIDFSRAGESLEAGFLPHGSIDRDLLKQWYRGRGREKRFEADEVVELLQGAGLELAEEIPFPDAPGTSLFAARRSA